MTTTPAHATRSPASLDLISLVGPDAERAESRGDTTVDLEFLVDNEQSTTPGGAVITKEAPVPARVSFRAPRDGVIEGLTKHGNTLRAFADSASCLTGVAHVQLVIRVAGEEALAVRFPHRALRRIKPALDALVRSLGATPSALALARW